MKTTKKKTIPMGHAERDCIICGVHFTGWGHNPEPVEKFVDGRACDICNATVVIPARLGFIVKQESK